MDMERSLSSSLRTLILTIDNGVAQSADGSLLWNLHQPGSQSGQRHLQEQVEEVEEPEFSENGGDFYDDEVIIYDDEEEAVLVPTSGAAVAGLEKQAFHATVEGCDCAVTGCTICLENFEDGEVVTVMPCSSGHEFHPDCITTWLGKSNTCPLCRYALPTEQTRLYY